MGDSKSVMVTISVCECEGDERDSECEDMGYALERQRVNKLI